MKREHAIYAAYMLFFIFLNGLIVLTPLLAFSMDMGAMYDIFAYTCHQKLSRSLCVFNADSSFWIADCTEQTGEFVLGKVDRTTIRVENDGAVGYKMPVCARDVGLYMALLLGGGLYPVIRELEDRKVYPAIYLILAIVPIGLDGGLQLASDIGLVPFAYESTNLVRLLTGGIAGVIASFFAIPILINMFSVPKPKNQ